MSFIEHAEILLVEDNPQDLELTLRALQRGSRERRINVARDGAEALDFLFCEGAYAERSPDQRPLLVLLDLKLPKVDGLEVLQRIKDDPRTNTIPVVIMTSSKEQSDIAESYRLGVNSYIVKPVSYKEFLSAVQKLEAYWLSLNQPSYAER